MKTKKFKTHQETANLTKAYMILLQQSSYVEKYLLFHTWIGCINGHYNEKIVFDWLVVFQLDTRKLKLYHNCVNRTLEFKRLGKFNMITVFHPNGIILVSY